MIKIKLVSKLTCLCAVLIAVFNFNVQAQDSNSAPFAEGMGDGVDLPAPPPGQTGSILPSLEDTPPESPQPGEEDNTTPPGAEPPAEVAPTTDMNGNPLVTDVPPDGIGTYVQNANGSVTLVGVVQPPSDPNSNMLNPNDTNVFSNPQPNSNSNSNPIQNPPTNSIPNDPFQEPGNSLGSDLINFIIGSDLSSFGALGSKASKTNARRLYEKGVTSGEVDQTMQGYTRKNKNNSSFLSCNMPGETSIHTLSDLKKPYKYYWKGCNLHGDYQGNAPIAGRLIKYLGSCATGGISLLIVQMIEYRKIFNNVSESDQHFDDPLRIDPRESPNGGLPSYVVNPGEPGVVAGSATPRPSSGGGSYDGGNSNGGSSGNPSGAGNGNPNGGIAPQMPDPDLPSNPGGNGGDNPLLPDAPPPESENPNTDSEGGPGYTYPDYETSDDELKPLDSSGEAPEHDGPNLLPDVEIPGETRPVAESPPDLSTPDEPEPNILLP